MLRVNSSNVLVVPPFECAWLALQDYDVAGAFCLSFEYKGENDVTIIFKPQPGAKRWQHLERQQQPAGGDRLAIEDNYTVILGSHRNSKLKFEKNGDTVKEVQNVPGANVSATTFKSCWVNYSTGVITVGSGSIPGTNIAYQWEDSGPPLPSIQHLGLSCWDKHVSYRNVSLQASLPTDALKQQWHRERQQQQQGACGAAEDQGQGQLQQNGRQLPSLVWSTMQSLEAEVCPENVCDILQVSERLLPATEQLYSRCVQLLAQCLEVLLLQELQQQLAALTVEALADVLQQPVRGLPERGVFEVVARWSGYHQPCCCVQQEQQQQQHHRQQQGALQEQQQQQQCLQVGEQQQQQRRVADAAGGDGDNKQQEHWQVAACLHDYGSSTCPGGSEEQQQQQGQFIVSPWRAAAEALQVLQLVHFVLMTPQELAEVQQHPFTRQYPFTLDLIHLQQGYPLLQTDEPASTAAIAASGCFGHAAAGAAADSNRSGVEWSADTTAAAGGGGGGGGDGSGFGTGGRGDKVWDSRLMLQQVDSGGGYKLQNRRLVYVAAAAADVTGGCSSPGSSDSPLATAAAGGCGGGGAGSFASAMAAAAAAVPGSGCSSGVGGGGGGASSAVDMLCKHDSGGLDGSITSSGSGSSRMRSLLVNSSSIAGGGSSGSGVFQAPQQVYQRRLAPRYTELMYVFDGDKNGVVWHIATEYGTRQWMNPVLSKQIQVKASSPASRYTDPKAILSGAFVPTSWAGPRYQDGTPVTWWCVDLGPRHRLMCNYYTMRQDGSTDFARDWVLQGSTDLNHWVDLRRHTGDTTLKLPGQYGSWQVTGPTAAMPFRAFRVKLTGPTVSATAPWNFCLCYLEFYGNFFKLELEQPTPPPPPAAAAAAASAASGALGPTTGDAGGQAQGLGMQQQQQQEHQEQETQAQSKD